MVVKTISQTYALDILEALAEKPLRFTDLEDSSPNERTRGQRLKELDELKMISTVSMKIGKRSFVHYTLTDKGRQVLQKAKEIEKI